MYKQTYILYKELLLHRITIKNRYGSPANRIVYKREREGFASFIRLGIRTAYLAPLTVQTPDQSELATCSSFIFAILPSFIYLLAQTPFNFNVEYFIYN